MGGGASVIPWPAGRRCATVTAGAAGWRQPDCRAFVQAAGIASAPPDAGRFACTIYIIIGAGSAGCVLANRPGAKTQRQGALLEAGPRDWHPFIHMPAGLGKLVNRKGVNWDYDTAPEPWLDNRVLWWPRGKVLGGSSSINAMCYIQAPADYDDWRRRARLGWSSVLPYFKRAEATPAAATCCTAATARWACPTCATANPLTRTSLHRSRHQAWDRVNRDFNGVGAGVAWASTRSTR